MHCGGHGLYKALETRIGKHAGFFLQRREMMSVHPENWSGCCSNLVILCYPTESAFTRFLIPQSPQQSSQSVEPIFTLGTNPPPQTLTTSAVYANRTHSYGNVTGALLKRCTLQGNFDATNSKVLLWYLSRGNFPQSFSVFKCIGKINW